MNRSKVDIDKWNDSEVLFKHLLKKGYKDQGVHTQPGLRRKIFLFHMFYTPDGALEYFVRHPETKKFRRYTIAVGKEIGFF